MENQLRNIKHHYHIIIIIIIICIIIININFSSQNKLINHLNTLVCKLIA
jgi:uncharacterized membrane protein YciS (DUF1049 family)